MKNISFIGITHSQTLLIKDGSACLESTFEGFTVTPALATHENMFRALGKGIECTLSKSNKIRYHNVSFFS